MIVFQCFYSNYVCNFVCNSVYLFAQAEAAAEAAKAAQTRAMAEVQKAQTSDKLLQYMLGQFASQQAQLHTQQQQQAHAHQQNQQTQHNQQNPLQHNQTQQNQQQKEALLAAATFNEGAPVPDNGPQFPSIYYGTGLV